jgi:hypothetical protein
MQSDGHCCTSNLTLDDTATRRFPVERELPARTGALPQVQVDERLVRHVERKGHVLEVVDGERIQPDGHRPLQLRRVRVLLRLREIDGTRHSSPRAVLGTLSRGSPPRRDQANDARYFAIGMDDHQQPEPVAHAEQVEARLVVGVGHGFRQQRVVVMLTPPPRSYIEASLVSVRWGQVQTARYATVSERAAVARATFAS